MLDRSRYVVLVLAGCSNLLGVSDLTGPGGDGSVDGNGAIGDSPASPVAMSPANGAYTGSLFGSEALRPTFRWDAVDRAVSYDLALDPSCTSGATCAFDQAMVVTGIAGTAYQPGVALAVATRPPVGTRYAWRLRACNPDGCSQWSRARYLSVGRVRNDFNGDGYGDLAIGVRDGNKVMIFNGSATGLATGAPPPASATIQSDGFVRLGGALATGDFNGDGYADLAATADPLAGIMIAPVLIYLGGPTGLAGATIAKRIDGPHQDVDINFGAAMATPGDVDGDGYDDLAIGGAPHAYLYRGSPAALVEHVELAAPTGTVFRAPMQLAAAGDPDGDGYPDLAITAKEPALGAETTVGIYRNLAVDPSQVLQGPTGVDEIAFGDSIAAADLDRDGRPELLVVRIVGFMGGDMSTLLVFPGTAKGFAMTPSGPPLVDPDGLEFANLLAFQRPDGTAVFASAGTRRLTVWDGARTRLRRIDGLDHFAERLGLCDCAGDGYSDLVAGDYTTMRGNAVVFDHTSSGVATTASRTLADPTGPSGEAFAIAISR